MPGSQEESDLRELLGMATAASANLDQEELEHRLHGRLRELESKVAERLNDDAQLPTPGRIVWYQTDGRNGLHYFLPAMVTVTKASHPGDYPDGRPNSLPAPSSDLHVHLTVLSPGGFGTEVHTADGVAGVPLSSESFVGAKQLIPGSGSYVEWDVPFDPDGGQRSWRWPERT
jgi:hypothetical protein